MAVKISYLVVDIIILILQLTVITCNGYILIFFIKEKRFRQNSSRQLVLFLVTTDFIHALAILPHTIYLIWSWNPVHLDLSPYYVMISSAPFIAELKINLTLTISIAVERALALSFPLVFRKLSHHSYASLCFLSGILLGALDLLLEFLLSPIQNASNCAALGCFISDKFRYYWGISNMMMGIMVIVMTSLVLMKIRAIRKQPNPTRTAVNSRENKFRQVVRKFFEHRKSSASDHNIWANRTCTGILLISLVFVTLPSVGVGFVESIGCSIFNAVGPFYIVGILCAGVSNSAVHFALNKDMRALGLKYICERGRALVNPGNPVRTITTSTV